MQLTSFRPLGDAKKGEMGAVGASSDVQDVSMITVQRMYSLKITGLITTSDTQLSPASSLRQVSFIYYMTDPEEEILEFSAAAAIAAVFPCPIQAQPNWPLQREILGLLGIFLDLQKSG